jgi:Zn-dependent metalloprotease
MMSLAPKLLSFAVLLALGGTATANTRSAAIERAQGLARANAGTLHASAQDRFSARDVIVDADGTEHVRFDRRYAGLPVIGGDVVVHSRGGRFRSASLTQRGELRLSTRPSQSQDDAVVSAGAEFGSDFRGVPGTSLVVYARGASPALAWQVDLRGVDHDGNDRDMTYIVDAKSGKVLDRWSNMETISRKRPGGGGGGGGGGSTCTGTTSATGTGKTLYSGNVAISTQNCGTSYQMKDLTRGSGYTTDMGNGTNGSGTIFSDADNTWGNNTTSDRASAGADAHFGVATTWDYFKNVHSRSGIADDGKGALSRVHYGRRYVNAFWSDSCFCMSFGDGNGSSYAPLVDLDVAGHEMSHGVTSRSADLTYSGESGGLNEATSDIFGTMVEFYANNANDTPDYLIGEEIYISNPGNTKALRWMYDPSKDGASPNCYVSNIGSLDVHYSSGLANHFFYLLAEGTTDRTYSGVVHHSPTCAGGATASGIGRAKAEKIWYRALTVYMTSNTNYAGARTATINAANDLYGPGSAEANAVAGTWTAVGVN